MTSHLTELVSRDAAQQLKAEPWNEPLRFAVCGDDDGNAAVISRLLHAASVDLMVILVDAGKGLLPQTRRHSTLAALVGARRIVLAVNGLELVGHSREAFERIEREYREFGKKLGLREIVCIPLARTPWYHGPALMSYLESVEGRSDAPGAPFRMPVQSLNGGYCGRISGGVLRPGLRVRVLPSGKESTVWRIVANDGELASAAAGQSVTVTLADEIDVKPGDLLTAADAPAEVADQFEATLVWQGEQPMLPGRPYLMKIGARTVGATVTRPKYKLNAETLEHLAAQTLSADEVGVCNLHLDEMVAFDPCQANRDTGSFTLIDRLTQDTIGVGLLHFALRRSHNIHWQALDVDKRSHAALKGQRPCVVWFTGLSGAGKSTIANLVEKKLHAMGRHTFILDGDNVRHGLNKDLGFTEADRVENIRRVAEVAKLMVDAGLIVLVSFISPFRAERRLARELVEDGEFCEVFVDTPLQVAEQRDPKGLYKKARRGELKNFTGIDSPYESPEQPELRLDTTRLAPEEAADRIVTYLRASGVLDRR